MPRHIGNPTPPTRLGKTRASIPGSRAGTRKTLSPFARAIFIVLGLVIALIFGLAIVSVSFRARDHAHAGPAPVSDTASTDATAPPSLAETIQSAVAKQITDELQGELSRQEKRRGPANA